MSQFSHDRRFLIDRRRSLGLLGAATGGLWLGSCGSERGPGGPPPGEMGPMRSYADVVGTGADGATCVAFPGETEGPYPADGRGRQTVTNVLGGEALQRTDIRSSFGTMQGTAQGVLLDLELTLVDVDKACAPLAGRALYIWHCDAAGKYSLYNLEDQNYLRGLQVADAAGMVRFRTIYPGCYDGRFPHIHLELFASAASAKSGSDALLTSQLALPTDADAAVYAAFPELYAGSTRNLGRVSLEDDNVFGDNTVRQRQAQTLAMSGGPAAGYRAMATIGYTATYAAG